MTNHTAQAPSTAPDDLPDRRGELLCLVCRVADGLAHVHPRDHLRAHGPDCACTGHADDARLSPFTPTAWPQTLRLSTGCSWSFRVRGPPLTAA